VSIATGYQKRGKKERGRERERERERDGKSLHKSIQVPHRCTALPLDYSNKGEEEEKKNRQCALQAVFAAVALRIHLSLSAEKTIL